MPWLIPLLQPNFGYGRGVLYLSLYIFGGSAAPSCLQIVYIYIYLILFVVAISLPELVQEILKSYVYRGRIVTPVRPCEV